MTDIRQPQAEEIGAIAQLWYHAWRDAHENILPEALIEDRTEASFRSRLVAMLPSTRVIGPHGRPRGFCTIKDDELYQLFVAREGRGTDIAIKLIEDAEQRLAAAGHSVAWLACAIGNSRAARFYEKRGWHLARTYTNILETAKGNFELDVWRYEKRLDVR